jgi:hypothetical protein
MADNVGNGLNRSRHPSGGGGIVPTAPKAALRLLKGRNGAFGTPL